MGFYGDFFPKVVCDPRSMFLCFFIPDQIPAEVVCKLVVFPLDVLDIEVISVCWYNYVRDFVRDVIQGFAVVDWLKCLLVGADGEVWAASQPVVTLLQTGDDGEVFAGDCREAPLFLAQGQASTID